MIVIITIHNILIYKRMIVIITVHSTLYVACITFLYTGSLAVCEVCKCTPLPPMGKTNPTEKPICGCLSEKMQYYISTSALKSS